VRLWSLHPRYLDTKGLVALWREGLLARAVLAGQTKGYAHHPQLLRFRRRGDPVSAIDAYLSRVLDEARARGYAFDGAKIRYGPCRGRAHVASGQLEYEWAHLLGKLRRRDPARWARTRALAPDPHPCFRVVPGEIAEWEKQ
jgi:hypothetical protein